MGLHKKTSIFVIFMAFDMYFCENRFNNVIIRLIN